MRISVIGLGYMGLPMAAVLARAGHEVVGVDINPKAVDAVNAGKCHFAEPGVPEIVAEAHKSGRLRAVAKPEAAEAFILSLPTPVDHTTHKADMSFVEAGAKAIAPVLKGGELVIMESTSPVGATEANVRDVIEKLRPDLVGMVAYVFCPERAIPGNTLHEMVHNDRLVGGLTEAATARGVELYKTFCKGAVIPTQARVAELVKLVENASRDAQIAFANELSLVCDQLGMDAWDVIALANRHPRVNIFNPGPGVGGHCIAVDPWFIIHAAPKVTPFMKAAREVNDSKPAFVAGKVRESVKRVRGSQGLRVSGSRVKVACLGLAYKPDVDDLRESPSIAVVEELAGDEGLELMIVEPHIESWDKPLTKLDKAIKEADVVVALTGHKVFKELPEGALAGKAVVDSCGVFRRRGDVSSTVSQEVQA